MDAVALGSPEVAIRPQVVPVSYDPTPVPDPMPVPTRIVRFHSVKTRLDDGTVVQGNIPFDVSNPTERRNAEALFNKMKADSTRVLYATQVEGGVDHKVQPNETFSEKTGEYVQAYIPQGG